MRSVLLCLLLPLAACTHLPKQEVPASLLQDCPHPAVSVTTNGELVRGLLAYQAALQSCNDDKAALRRHVKAKATGT